MGQIGCFENSKNYVRFVFLMDQKRTERRHRYFRAALKSMGKTGLNGLAMARLSKSSGMAVGSWYHHFPSREALVNGIYGYCAERASAALMSGLDLKSGTGDNVRGMVRSLGIHWQKYPEEARFFMETEAGQVLAKKVRAEAWLSFDAVLTVLRTARDRGSLRNMPEQQLLGFILGAVYGAGMLGSNPDADVLAEGVWQGMKMRKG